MRMTWTEAQQRVIDTRNKNLLISAAAGSGKTAVLVERIISMISEGEEPIDIDHLLVVTFTNAAAAQMRERIGKALDKKLVAEPDNKHLQRQVSLLQSANITTIHSFCLNVIRNYFHQIDLDPSFKLADDAENTLLRSDVMAEVLERWYEEGREDFHEFIESYSRSKSDLPVEELVLQLFHFSMSNPWPKLWLEDMEKSFQLDSLEEMEATDWMQELLGYIGFVLEDLARKNEEAMAICNESDGPGAYLTALLSDREIIKRLQTAETYEEYARLFPKVSYARLSAKREEGVTPEKKDAVKALREEIKKGLKDLLAQFFFQSPEEMLQDLSQVKGVMKVLFQLTIDFMDAFALKKEEKNLIDFNDLEHFALNILVEETDEGRVPSRAAQELSEQFEEILIDEYQDSNLVQETILTSISREGKNRPNRFMVGDVKQSIYKFRLAMPELFMEKYKTYSTMPNLDTGEANLYQRIDLDKNFRSRRVVLDSVNAIFEQIMTESVGGITYDEAASLKYGELFEEMVEKADKVVRPEEYGDRIATDIELMLVTEEEAPSNSEDDSSHGKTVEAEQNQPRSGEEVDSEETQEDLVYTKKELEARAIARKIKEMVDPEKGLLVFDRDSLSHRPAVYGDMVILLRSMTGWSEVFVNTLMQEGIPAYADTGTGYFQTVEIMTVLNMLRIIDNPRQDIPFAGVMYSPMAGLTTTELAKLRIASRNTGLYQAALAYGSESSDETGEDELERKLKRFLTLLDDLRSKMSYTPIHAIIEELLERTRYYYYILAMPGGDRRKANIDMLVNRAVQFEKGSYSGLFHFIRYIEKLHKYEVDFGEAAASGEQDNTVRIMSIHKSKGLEFPVVFVGGLSKQFNTQDMRKNIVIHADYGVGPEYIDTNLRTKVPTLLKKMIQKKIQVENLGEELRVLYVAMTRAKEKLILSGYLNSMEEIQGKGFSFFELISSKSYMEYVLPAVVNKMGALKPLEVGSKGWSQGDFSITLYRKNEILEEELTKQIILYKDEEELRNIASEEGSNPQLREEIQNRFRYTYPHEKASGLKVKLSVSELKRMGQFLEDEDGEVLYQKMDKGPIDLMMDLSHGENATIPNFIQGIQEQVSGTDRGTLYHKVLELLDLSKARTKEEVLQEIEHMVRDKKLGEGEKDQLRLHSITTFAGSPIARRMRQAQAQGKLYKEKQFVIGIKSNEIIKDQDSDEFVLVQGIIDAFFEEDGELVLIDYKSDFVKDEHELVKRYEVQLQYYQRALEQILKKRVKERIIYSLHLGKEIKC